MPVNDESNDSLKQLSAQVVSAYVANNAVPATSIAALITDIHASFSGLGDAGQIGSVETLQPAVPVKKSVTPNYIICLEDGKQFKTLRRHLSVHFGLTPEEYRTKWGLPSDYPMVAPNYAEARSNLAKAAGLGRKPGEKAKAAPKSRKKA